MVEAEDLRIIRTQELTEEAKHILFEWTIDPFCARQWGLIWRPKTDHVLIHCRDRLASHVGLIRDTVHVGDCAIEVGGIGDVITVPEFQGRGFAEVAIQKALDIIWNDWDITYATLFCFPPLRSFYERRGWMVIEAPIWIAQPAERIRFPALKMFLSRHGEPWPAGKVEIGGLPW